MADRSIRISVRDYPFLNEWEITYEGFDEVPNPESVIMGMIKRLREELDDLKAGTKKMVSHSIVNLDDPRTYK